MNIAIVCMDVQLFELYPDLESGTMLQHMIIRFSVISGTSMKMSLVISCSSIAYILTRIFVSLSIHYFPR